MINCYKNVSKNWTKIGNSIKSEVSQGTVYNKKYLKTKIKSYMKKKSIQIFTISKEGSKFICLYLILIQFIEQMKAIILKCFLKNVTMLLIKQRCLTILLMI